MAMTSQENKPDLKELEKRFKANPSDVTIQNAYAEALLENGYLDEAFEQYKSLMALLPDNAELIFNAGIICDKQNKFDEALDLFEKAVELEPEEADFRYNLAFVLDKKGEIDRAIEEYKKTIELDPIDSNTHFNLGCLYVKKNERGLAREHFKRTLEINPKDIYARFNLAYEYKQSKELDKALEEYNKLLETAPDYSWAYYNIGCIYHEQGKKDEAFDYFVKTLKANPKDVEVCKIITNMALKSNKIKPAIECLELAITKNPDNGDLHYYISKFYEKMEEVDDQRFHLEKALDNKESLTIDPKVISEELKKISKK